ncbi:MAG: methyltransferase domain-containing protein [Myxococcota bacterium]
MTIYAHLSALSEPTRVRMLHVLEHHELTVGEIARILALPQSTVSRHIKTLHEDGWLQRRSLGPANLLQLQPSALAPHALRLWQLVREDLAEQYDDDLRRLHAVIAMREDSTGFFERMAGRWDALRRDLFGDAFLQPFLLSMLPPDLVVADLGCGTGQTLEALAPNVQQVIGVDREAAMLSLARSRLADANNVTLYQSGLEDLPLDDQVADIALLMLVLHHIRDVPAALTEARRILRPDGQILILDLVAHDRVEFQRTMGHKHLGFSTRQLTQYADTAELYVDHTRLIPQLAQALGPPLFVARLRR